jgi:SAM-dependent methyltransferase
MLMNDIDDPVQALVDRKIAEGGELRVLEAGAGSRSHLRLGANAYVVGIDVSEEGLAKNSGLHQKILGDLETFPLEPSSFDIIFCWDVLEHLKHPEKALQSFHRAIREGGLIVLGGPVVTSLKGMITKYTPYWFHDLVYRYLLRRKPSGGSGHPFPTYLRYSISPNSLHSFARQNHLSVEYFTVYEEMMQVRLKQRFWAIGFLFRFVGPILKFLSFGIIDPQITDFTMVLRKPVNQSTPAATPQLVRQL